MTDDIKALVRKLRTEWPVGPGNRIACQTMDEAAEAIERLAQENEALKGYLATDRAMVSKTAEDVAFWKRRAEAAEARVAELEGVIRAQNYDYDRAMSKVHELEAGRGVVVKPLIWEYHPAGTIAAPPTGHSYILDTRMKGRCYSIKGFSSSMYFDDLETAKVAAQADYERRIFSAITTPAEYFIT